MPEDFEYVYSRVKQDVLLASISGGTDICSCFALGNPLLPVKPAAPPTHRTGRPQTSVLHAQGGCLRALALRTCVAILG